MNTGRHFGILLLLTAFLALEGCSSKVWDSPNKADEHPLFNVGKKKELKDIQEGWQEGTKADEGKPSLITVGEEGGLLGNLTGGGSRRMTREEIRADRLFAGALDVVLDLPVMVASREGGFVSTDWKVNPKDDHERYRLNIRVSGKEPYGEVKVVVLRQEMVKGEWQDRTADPDMANQIQKAIRNRSETVKTD